MCVCVCVCMCVCMCVCVCACARASPIPCAIYTWKHSGGGNLDNRLAQATGSGKYPPGTAFIPTPGKKKKKK